MPLNLGVEIVHLRSIRKYLFWGSIVVMVAYLWATLGTMLALNAAHSQADDHGHPAARSRSGSGARMRSRPWSGWC